MSNTTAGFRKDGDDEDNDSVNLFAATVIPSKKKGCFSNEDSHIDHLIILINNN